MLLYSSALFIVIDLPSCLLMNSTRPAHTGLSGYAVILIHYQTSLAKQVTVSLLSINSVRLSPILKVLFFSKFRAPISVNQFSCRTRRCHSVTPNTQLSLGKPSALQGINQLTHLSNAVNWYSWPAINGMPVSFHFFRA
jgi:hypothetical protein